MYVYPLLLRSLAPGAPSARRVRRLLRRDEASRHARGIVNISYMV